jgi:hypothetical protein
MVTNQSMLSDLSPDRFIFRCDILPEVAFRVKSAPIPGIATTPPIMGVPNARHRFRPNPQSVEISGLAINFIVDEELNNWLECFKWIERVTMSDNLMDDGIIGNATLLVLDSEYNNVLECHFQDCVPESLSDINLDVDNDATNLIATLTISFNSFRLIGKNFTTEWL